MSMKRITLPLPVLMLMIVGITLVALGGGYLLSGDRSGAVERASEFEPGDVDRRGERLGESTPPDRNDSGQTPEPGDTAAAPAPQSPADGTPPGMGAQFDAIVERLAADQQRLEERRRLASESPLTPGVEDAAGIARQGRRTTANPAGPAQGSVQGSVQGPKQGPAQGSAQGWPAQGPVQANMTPGQTVIAPGMRPAGAGTGFAMDAPTYLLARGSVVPAVLQTPLDSDLPGLVRAQVSEDVRDSASGRHVLIPRGAHLVGTYGSDASSGQRRLFIAWTDLRLPGSEDTLPLDRTGTLGADGASGVRGRRSTGLLAALGAAVLLDLAGNATAILTDGESGSGNDGDLGAILAAATGNATGRVADRYLGDLLSRGPRFRVAAGTRMNVLIETDMRLPTWEGG